MSNTSTSERTPFRTFLQNILDAKDVNIPAAWDIEKLSQLTTIQNLLSVRLPANAEDSRLFTAIISAKISNPRIGLLGWKINELNELALEIKEYLDYLDNDDKEEKPELDDEWFEQAEVHQGGVLKRRGRPKLERPKISISIRLDADVIESFKATGSGWQTTMNAALRKASGLDDGVWNNE